MDVDHRVSSVVDNLQNVKSTKAQEVELELERIQAMDFANRESTLLKRTGTTKRKSVRFSAKTGQYRKSISPAEINTSAGHRRYDSNRDTDTLEPPVQQAHHQEELLMPVRYSPPSDVESGSEHSTLSDDSWNSLKHDNKQPQAQYALPESGR